MDFKAVDEDGPVEDGQVSRRTQPRRTRRAHSPYRGHERHGRTSEGGDRPGTTGSRRLAVAAAPWALALCAGARPPREPVRPAATTPPRRHPSLRVPELGQDRSSPSFLSPVQRSRARCCQVRQKELGEIAPPSGRRSTSLPAPGRAHKQRARCWSSGSSRPRHLAGRASLRCPVLGEDLLPRRTGGLSCLQRMLV
jgi:hypothetical protein